MAGANGHRREVDRCRREIAREITHQSRACVDHQAQRIEIARAVGGSRCLCSSSPRGQVQPVKTMNRLVAWIECERCPVGLLGAHPVPLEDSLDLCEHQVRFRIGSIQLQRAQRRSARVFERRPRLEDIVADRAHVGPCQSRVRERELRIERQRLLEKSDRGDDPLVARFVPVIAPFQVGLVRLDVTRAHLRRIAVHRQQLHRQRTHDFGGHFGLDLEVVREVTLVRIGPQLRFAARLDQLHRDARAIAVAPHVAFHHEVDAQRLPDIADPRRCPLNERRRHPCDHAEASGAQAAELSNHLLTQSLGEVLVTGLVRHARERQHRETPLGA